MNTRIDRIFARCKAENRPARILFASCGFPTLQQSERVIETMIEQGADIIELGAPFSDPVADGPVIQAASQQAIAHGATLRGILQMAARIRRRHPETGLILFSYFNILLNARLEALCDRLAETGIDGILCVDLPYEERDELKPLCDARGLHLIPLVSPETDETRIPLVTSGCTGFAYAVTVSGITGARRAFPPTLAARLETIRRLTTLPVVAGFGIADTQTARAIGLHADGIVIGSAAIRPLLENQAFEEGLFKMTTFLRNLFGGSTQGNQNLPSNPTPPSFTDNRSPAKL